MSAIWVLKFQQIDKPNQPILVHVTQKHPGTLDLDLIATDGEEAYKGKVRQRNLSKLQSQNYEGTDDAWIDLLRYALVSRQASDNSAEQTRNLDIDCVISGKGTKAKLSITLRSRIEDITHKLGAIELAYSESTDDVDLFGWACQLAEQRDDFQTQALSKYRVAESAKTTISKLQSQLNDLVKAKVEHEEQLLSKFAVLLNEKKMKIRDQQRVLKTAKVDEDKLAEAQRGTSRTAYKGTANSKRKRDADVLENGGKTEDQESDGFESMDVDSDPDGMKEGDDIALRRETPPRSSTPETATSSEDERDLVMQSTTRAEGKVVESKAASQLPPPRSLPFQKKTQKTEVKQVAQVPIGMDEDEETESEDDEL